MKFIERIHITKTYRTLKKKSIELEDITLLVGDQGCGKSTLLSQMQQKSEGDTRDIYVEIDMTPEASKKGISVYYFDTESMNPRIQSLDAFANIDGTNRGIGIGGKLSTHFMSHGEALRNFTVDAIKKVKNDSFIMLDEPESALSVKNQYKLANNLVEIVQKKTCQFLIATHCIPLIAKVGRVYDLENYEWVDSKDYLKRFE